MAKTFSSFQDVQNALQTFVTSNNIPISGAPHGNMWQRGTTPDQQYKAFVTGDAITGFPIMKVGDGANSNIILALRGQSPFDGSSFPRMPVGGPYLDDGTITAIEGWITAGAPQQATSAAKAGAAFTTFSQVQNALQSFVTDNNIPVSGAPHGNMWERGTTPDQQYKAFVTGVAISGFPILQVGDGANSNIILALRGQSPFDGSTFPRMPVGGPYLDDGTITAIEGWITNGAKQ
jgi:hypothetical protein